MLNDLGRALADCVPAILASSINRMQMNHHEAGDDISVVITSCGRQDLIERTISSFVEYNTYPISKYIVIEDGLGALNASLQRKYQHLPITWLETGQKIGQIRAIDRA